MKLLELNYLSDLPEKGQCGYIYAVKKTSESYIWNDFMNQYDPFIMDNNIIGMRDKWKHAVDEYINRKKSLTNEVYIVYAHTVTDDVDILGVYHNEEEANSTIDDAYENYEVPVHISVTKSEIR